MDKMNILITGPGGFLGKELAERLRDHNILPIGRFDVTNENHLEHVLKTNKVDVVIHTATRGGKRTREDTFQDMIDNVTMFNNLVKHRDKFKILFCFCSGAAFNREEEIDNISESEIFNRKPFDYYGLSKNLIAREVHKYDSVFNLRLFGCFGFYEEDARFFSSIWRNILSNKPVEIHQNKKMDYFSARDVGGVIRFYMKNYTNMSLPKDINLVYPNKVTLAFMAEKFTKLMSPLRASQSFGEEVTGKPYTGSSESLDSLGIPLEGMIGGFLNSYGGEMI